MAEVRTAQLESSSPPRFRLSLVDLLCHLGRGTHCSVVQVAGANLGFAMAVSAASWVLARIGGFQPTGRSLYPWTICLWIAAWVVSFSFTWLLLALGTSYELVYRRHWTVLLLAVMSPLAVTIGTTVYQYAAGTATLHYTGLPGTEFHNLDPELRCGRTTGGCVVRGGEHLIDGLERHVLVGLIRTCGPMRGSYLGSYPTRDEAIQAVYLGEEQSYADLTIGQIKIDGETIQLDQGVGPELARVRGEEYGYFTLPQIRAAMWQDDCLILSIPTWHGPSTRGEPSECIVLICRQRGRPFAYYGRGNYDHRFPPVSWHRN